MANYDHITGADLIASWEEARVKHPKITPWEHAQLDWQMPYSIYAGKIGLARKQLTDLGHLFNRFDLEKPWSFEGDFMMCGDLHVPYTDWEFLALVPQVAKKQLKKPRRLLIGGDFFNFDTFSTYKSVIASPEWHDERMAARACLRLLLDTFDEIWLIMGNHCRRLQKFTMGAFDNNDLISMVLSDSSKDEIQLKNINKKDKVQMSNFGYCTVDTVGGPWRITHPTSYSQLQLSVAEALSWDYNCHVMTFHEHHTAQGWDRYKNHILVNVGMMAKQDRFPYKTMDDKRAANFSKSFAMLKSGVPYLFGEEPFTDYSKWL